MARRRNRKGQYTRARRPRHRRRRTMHTSAHTPHRYRRRHVRYNAPRRRHHRRRRYRRNPPMLSRGMLGGLIPPLAPIGFAVAGATATRFIANQVEGYFPNLAVSADPSVPGGVKENKLARTAVKIAAALATGYLGGMFLGRQRGSQLAAGGLVIVTDELLRTEVLPKMGLSEYVEPYEVVEAYIPNSAPALTDAGIPGAELMGAGEYESDISDFMTEDYTPGRLNPSERLS